MTIPARIIAEAIALKNRGYSLRKIAREMHGTISRAALSYYLDRAQPPQTTTTPDDLHIPHPSLCSRCPRCHRLVTMPCLACKVETFREALSASPARKPHTARRLAKPSDLPLIQRIRAAKRALRHLTPPNHLL